MTVIERLEGHRGKRGVRIGRLVVQVCTNSAGAPLVDHAFTYGRDADGNELWRSSGRALSLTRRRNEHDERLAGPALYFGWIVNKRAPL